MLHNARLELTAGQEQGASDAAAQCSYSCVPEDDVTFEAGISLG